jgi:hypothetical protein
VKAALQNPAEILPQVPSRFLPAGPTRTEHSGQHGRTSLMMIPAEVAPSRAEIVGERAPVEKPAPASDEYWDRMLGPVRGR